MTTYWTGIVNESDLCYLGGFPGPLRNLLGIWAEEIDCLNDGEFNLVQGLAGNQCGLQGPYQVRHLCELIHIESAQALATYRDDLCRTAGCDGERVRERQSLACGLPQRFSLPARFLYRPEQGAGPAAGDSDGVTTRRGGDCAPTVTTHLSSCRTTAQNHTLTLPQGYWDCLTDAAVSAPLTLSAWDCRILRRHA